MPHPRRLPGTVVRLLTEFLDEHGWPSMAEAKDFRARLRSEIVKCKSGFGSIHYGNCGNVEFVPDFGTLGSSKNGMTEPENTVSGSG